MVRVLLCTALALVGVGGVRAATTVYSAADAVRLAETTPAGRSGRFEMTVVSTGRTPNGTFLHSTADYRGDDDLTVRLTPIVARMLAKRYGAPAETFFMGRHLIVDGKVERKLIANTLYGRPRSVNRYQHEIDVTQAGQIVAIE